MFEISCEEWKSVDRFINILHNKDGLPKSSFKIPAKKYPELQLTRSFFCIFNSTQESYQLFAKPKNNLDPEETLKGGLNLVYKLVSINGKKIILKKRKYKPKKINESYVNQQQINRDEFRKTINLYRADGFYKVHKENDKIVSFTTYDFEEKNESPPRSPREPKRTPGTPPTASKRKPKLRLEAIKWNQNESQMEPKRAQKFLTLF